MQLKDLSSAISGRAFPDHPYFPQLKTASDPSSMLDLFRKHLKPLSARAAQIQECVPVRFRWRRDGSRCILQYALRLGGEGNSDPFPVWVTCVIYSEAGEAEKVWNELKIAVPAIPENLLTFQPLTLIPEFRMVTHVFPYDRLIPNLPSIMSGPWPELQERLLACFGPGRWQLEQQTVEPLRYLMEDAAVVSYTLDAREVAAGQAQAR